MSEFVWEEVERSLEDLAACQRAGLLTENESSRVVRVRSKYEQLLRQRARDEVFIAYVNYESHVHNLILSRAKSMKTKARFSASRHLRRLLLRSVSLKPRNIEIWKAFVSYCGAFGSSKLLSRVLARALRHNSDCVGLWLSCATYEFRKNRNSEAARRLFQRALRSCHGDQDVWVAYFTFELEFASQLQQRHSLLAPSGRDYAAISPHMEGVHVREGGLALLVFKKAMESYPDDKDFCLRMFSVTSKLNESCKLLRAMRKTIRGSEAEIFATIMDRWAVSREDFVKCCLELCSMRMVQRTTEFQADVNATFSSRFSECVRLLENTRCVNEKLLQGPHQDKHMKVLVSRIHAGGCHVYTPVAIGVSHRYRQSFPGNKLDCNTCRASIFLASELRGVEWKRCYSASHDIS